MKRKLIAIMLLFLIIVLGACTAKETVSHTNDDWLIFIIACGALAISESLVQTKCRK